MEIPAEKAEEQTESEETKEQVVISSSDDEEISIKDVKVPEEGFPLEYPT